MNFFISLNSKLLNQKVYNKKETEQQRQQRFNKYLSNSKNAIQSNYFSQIYNIDEVVVDINIYDTHTSLPGNVDLASVIKQSIAYLFTNLEYNKKRDKIFKELLINDYHKFIISGQFNFIVDGFWLVNCVFYHPHKPYHKILKKRIKQNYVKFIVNYPEERDRNYFFENYASIVSQAIIQSLIFSYPKSREKFNIPIQVYKKINQLQIVKKLQKLFGSIISQPEKIIKQFVFNKEMQELNGQKIDKSIVNQDTQIKLPQIQVIKHIKVIQQIIQPSNSSSMSYYLQSKNQKSSNLKQFLSRDEIILSNISNSEMFKYLQIRIQTQLDQMIDKSKSIFKHLRKQNEIIQLSKKEILKQITQIKDDTKRQKALIEKRINEDIKNDRHENVNYLVAVQQQK